MTRLSGGGDNWASVTVTITAVLTALGAGAAWIIRRIDRSRRVTAVKLEQISGQLAAGLAEVRERIARLEGWIRKNGR